MLILPTFLSRACRQTYIKAVAVWWAPFKVTSRAPKRMEWDSIGLHSVSCSTAADTLYSRADGAVTGLANVCLDAPPNVCTSATYERSGTLGRAALACRVGP